MLKSAIISGTIAFLTTSWLVRKKYEDGLEEVKVGELLEYPEKELKGKIINEFDEADREIGLDYYDEEFLDKIDNVILSVRDKAKKSIIDDAKDKEYNDFIYEIDKNIIDRVEKNITDRIEEQIKNEEDGYKILEETEDYINNASNKLVAKVKAKMTENEDISSKEPEEDRICDDLDKVDYNLTSNNCFIVFQNKTYEEESSGNYLFAPRENKNGNEIFHWLNINKIKKGDIVLSIYERHIISINIARGSHYKYELDDKNLEEWEKTGWKVDLEYHELENPIDLDEHVKEILKLNPDKYAPFDKNGGGNQGYIYESGKELGRYLIDQVLKNNDI